MIKVRKAILSLAVVALPLLTACTIGTGSNVGPGGFGTPPPGSTSFMYYSMEHGSPLGSPELGLVAYPITATSTAAITLNSSAGNGLNAAREIAFDPSGRLFVSNDGNNTVSVFTLPLTANGAASFILTLPALVPQIEGIAIDSAGNMFISTSNSEIYEWKGPFNSTMTLGAPNVTLTLSGGSSGMAFDAAGNLWAASSTPTNGISEFKLPPGGFVTGTPVDHTLTGLLNPTAVAFDKAGNLYSSGQSISPGVGVYLAAHVGTPGASPDVFDSMGLKAAFSASQMTVDSAGNLYVSVCAGTGGIYVYPLASAPLTTSTMPLYYTDANLAAHFGCAAGIAVR